MKKFLLTLLILFMTATANAEVYAEIIGIDQDSRTGAIIVKTQYKIDGVEVVSNYPKLNGKYYFVTRYNINQFAGMTDLEAKNYILSDLTVHAKTLVRRTYLEKSNFDYVQAKANLLIGINGTVNQASIYVDTDADGVPDTEWVVNTDGTRTENPYTP